MLQYMGWEVDQSKDLVKVHLFAINNVYNYMHVSMRYLCMYHFSSSINLLLKLPTYMCHFKHTYINTVF